MAEVIFKLFNLKIVLVLAFIVGRSLSINYQWGKWKPSSGKCPRRCRQQHGIAPLNRHCMRCTQPNDCRSTSTANCRGLTALRGKCYIGNQCSGYGKYTGEWSEWRAKGSCETAVPRCGEKGTQVFTRKCEKTKRSRGSFACAVLSTRGDRSIKRSKCVRKCSGGTSLSAEAASRLHGRWGPWSKWTCTKDCDKPDSMATRQRKCKNFMAGYFCQVSVVFQSYSKTFMSHKESCCLYFHENDRLMLGL